MIYCCSFWSSRRVATTSLKKEDTTDGKEDQSNEKDCQNVGTKNGKADISTKKPATKNLKMGCQFLCCWLSCSKSTY